MSEAVPAEQAAAAEKKRPLLRRVPTSLLVTLLGIALTAWLLPAFTRQWDDRQKARALKAELADSVSAATANLLASADRLTEARGSQDREYPTARDEWRLASLRIEATLRTYFDSEQVADWRQFTNHGFVILKIAKRLGTESAAARLSSKNATQVDQLAARIFNHPQACRGRPAGAWRERLSGAKPAARVWAFEDGMESYFLGCASARTDALLAGHPKGYSTTTHDLLRDLVP